MTSIETTQSPLGAAVATAMKAQGLSQMALAKKASVPQASISDLINGKAAALKLDNVQALAGALETTVGALLGEAAQASPAGDAAAILVPFDKLRASPLNPRKTFDEEGLADLATSIREQGILQPISARPDPERPDGFEVIIGGRRLRAAGINVEAGHWPADHGIPVSVTDCDDVAALAMATAENVQRADMHPLEEGEAFLELRNRGRRTEEIAEQVGKTQRWVQERLRVAENLCSEGRTHFAAGNISLADAKELSRASPVVQNAALFRLKQDYQYSTARTDTADLRRYLVNPFPSVKSAIFKRELYEGEMIAAGDELEGVGYHRNQKAAADPERFADVEQFQRLQEDAIKLRVEKLSKKWPWVDRVDAADSFHPECYGPGVNYTDSESMGTGEPGAVVHVNPRTFEVKTHGKLWRRPTAKAGRAKTTTTGQAAERDPVKKIGSTRRVLARNVKTRAIQTELSEDFTIALQVACTAMMGARHGCRIQLRHPDCADQEVIAPQLTAVFKLLADALNGDRKTKLVSYSENSVSICLTGGSWRDNDDKVFDAVRSLPDQQLRTLFAALVAGATGSFAHSGGSSTGIGDAPMAVAIADALGTVTETHWRMDAAYLATLTKAELLALGPHLELFGPGQVDDGREWAKMKTADLRKALLDYIEANDIRHVPPEMQIQGTLATEAAIRADAKGGKR